MWPRIFGFMDVFWMIKKWKYYNKCRVRSPQGDDVMEAIAIPKTNKKAYKDKVVV
jgi:hypothetical protein